MKSNSPYLAPGLFFAIALVYLDQLTKWLVFEKVLRQDGNAPNWFRWMTTRMDSDAILAQYDIYKSVALAPFMNFIMVWNKGVSFGMFAGDSDIGKYLLIAIAIVISALMLAGLIHATRALLGYSFAMVIGGAIGNVIDRLRFGAVADFVDVHLFGYHWPAFNLADSCIVLGAILLIVDALLHKEHHNEENKNGQEKAEVK